MPKQRKLSGKRITFRHPAYEDDDDDNVILELPGFDHESGGVHHATALVVCGIIACNTWNGYFTRTKDGAKIGEAHDEILLGSEYYFHNPEYETSQEAFPLFACFNDWVFPHGRIPPTFDAVITSSMPRTSREDTPAANLSQAIIDRDQTCRVSDYGDGLEVAHLCPSNVDVWWRANRMVKYCKNRSLPSNSVTADVNNAIALRKDIHHIMDDQKFAIVPKADAWKLHFFGPTKILGGKYHNRAVQQLSPEVSAAFILARLAWTVFPLARDFMEAGPRRRIKVRSELRELNDYWVNGQEIRLSHGQSTRRGNQSPTKRSIASGADDDGPKKRACYPHADDDEECLNADRTAARIYQWRSAKDLDSYSPSTEHQPAFPASISSRPSSSRSSLPKDHCNCNCEPRDADCEVGGTGVIQTPNSDCRKRKRESTASESSDIGSLTLCDSADVARLAAFAEISDLKRKWLERHRSVEF